MKATFVTLISLLTLSLFGCATASGPAVIMTYDKPMQRENIAIVLLSQKRAFRILACDDMPVPVTTKYLLVLPGRHKLIFSINTTTLLGIHEMRNKKYIDVREGHTYVLKSETGILSVGDKWFPEVIDVTNNPELHAKILPTEGVTKNDK